MVDENPNFWSNTYDFKLDKCFYVQDWLKYAKYTLWGCEIMKIQSTLRSVPMMELTIPIK